MDAHELHQPLTDLSRLAVHTMTLKPLSLSECVDVLGEAGVPAISVWRNVVDPEEGGCGLGEAVCILQASGLRVPALVRGGFFPAHEASLRQAAIDHNLRCLDEAAALGAEMVVLVVGAVPGIPLARAREWVTRGIEAILPRAESLGIRLAIEPLHPMYAGDKSCVNRIAESREIYTRLPSPWLGVAVDVYHVWFDPDLESEIRKVGEAKRLFAFHVCDWRLETRNLLTDRGLMGDGCIYVPGIRAMVEAAGFCGWNEVEVFSEEYWAMDQREVMASIVERYLSVT